MLTIGLRIWVNNLSTETIQYVFWHVGYPLPKEIEDHPIASVESDGHENVVFERFSKQDAIFRNKYGFYATGSTAKQVLKEYKESMQATHNDSDDRSIVLRDCILLALSAEDAEIVSAFFNNASIVPAPGAGTRSLTQAGWTAVLPGDQGKVTVLQANSRSPVRAMYQKSSILIPVIDTWFDVDKKGVADFADFLREVAEKTEKL